jgi:hypothetical protein
MLRREGAVLCAIAVAFGVSGSSAFAVSAPNPALTPGSTDPRVTQATVATTICTRGYTATVRNVSTQTKHAVYVEYGIPKSAQRGYVIDHLVPLEVGGANDPRNLWPEPKADAKVKDRLEGQMHTGVCAGTISLVGAQSRFTTSAVPAPATAAPTAAAPSSQVVHPGAFCAPVGATGVTSAGTPMICSSTSASGTPYTQPRWRSG